jgi:GTP-binding protein YchF
MDIGIVGLAASGKTTLFELMTSSRGDAVRRDVTTVGIARVPDPRLDTLSAMFRPAKITPATIRYQDVPGLPEEHRAELNVPELRTADVLMIVVRGFASDVVPHPLETVDPLRDLARIEEEFVIQDLFQVERRLERLAKDLAKRRDPVLAAEQATLERCRASLEDERPLRDEEFTGDELKRLRGFTFLSLKPALVVVNLDESDPAANPFSDPAWATWMDRPRMAFTRVCATLEGELADLDGDDAAAFMDDLGLEDRALDRIIQESYRLLGLISFFTVGEDECRAWSIPAGTTAVEAAGAIHSDIQRGFIRAEVVDCQELVDAGSLAACRQRGTLRLEGKTYVVRDGEIVHYRFNV